MSSVGRIDLDLGINYNQFNKDLNNVSHNAESMVGGAFKKLGILIAGAFAIGGMISFGKTAIGLASDLAEVQNVVDVTFGKMSGQVDTFAKNALQSFGLSELSAKKFASTMGAMLKSSGLGGQNMTNMSESLVGLSADFASFYNLKPEEAFDKIRAGISGETEPLKQLGINMNVANLEAYALTKGIRKQYDAMSQAEQVLLRYNYMLSVSKDAQGDFARTSGSWANQTRLLGEQWKIFQGTMGQGFINILTPMLQALNTFILKLQTAALYFKAFTEMIWGSSTAAGTATVATATLAASTADVGKAAASSAAGITKASKAAKGALAPFDQLNVLTEHANASMGSMGKDSIAAPNIPAAPKIPKIDAGAIKDMFKGLDFGPIIKSFNKLEIAIKPFAQTLFSGLKWFWDNVLVPFGTWTVTAVIPAFLDLLSGAFTVLNPLVLGFQPMATWLWNNFLQPIAAWTGGAIVSILTSLGDALKTIGEWMTQHQGTVNTITLAVTGFFAAWKLIEVMAFVQMSGGIVGAFTAITAAIWTNTGAKVINAAETVYLTALYAKDFLASIVSGTIALGKQTIAWIASTAAMVLNKIQLLAIGVIMAVQSVAGMVASTGALLKNTGAWIASTAAMVINKGIIIGTSIAQFAMTAATIAWNVAAGIGAVVTTAFGVAVAILTSPITLVIAAIALLAGGIYLLIKNWDKVKEVAGTVWESIKSVWSVAYTWLNTNVIKPIANLYIGLFNGIISGVNWVIRALNKIKFDIPDWVPMIGGKSFGISIPEISKIPALANGGLVKSPTLAMVGDNRHAASDPEVVSPLSKLQGMMGGGNQEMLAALQAILYELKHARSDVVLTIGETEIGRAVIKAINIVQRQTGRTLLNI